MSKEFQLGDLVWAKMKGYCPWPGRIAKPTSKLKPSSKPGHQCVFFYGTRNYALIEDENIKPYFEYKLKFENRTNASAFKKSLKDIEEFIKMKKMDPNYDPDEDVEKEEDEFDRVKQAKPTPPKKARKQESGTKRNSSTPKASPPKRFRSTIEENGASPSYTANSHINKIDEILNRADPDLPEPPTVDLGNVSKILKKKEIEASTSTFGFIGLGIMGSGILKNLINSGHKVNIYTRSLQKAIDFKAQADIYYPGKVETYTTPCDLVSNSDVIFCCISDPTNVKEVVIGNCGILHGIDSLDGKGYVEMTNIDTLTSIDICEQITAKGGRYLEAQLQGSKQEADDGNLVVLAAGDMSLFNECRTCFEAMSKTIFHLGEVGFATKMNLALQVIKGVALVGVAEGLALADRSGIAPKDVLEIFELTGICSPYLKSKAELITKLSFKTVVEQPLQHMQKDLRLALQLADQLKQPLLMASSANEVYKHMRRLGYDSYDVSSVYMRSRY